MDGPQQTLVEIAEHAIKEKFPQFQKKEYMTPFLEERGSTLHAPTNNDWWLADCCF
jgi:hypothetical protein